MKKIIWMLALSLILSGCRYAIDGTYVSIKPYEQQGTPIQSDSISAVDYDTLCAVLEDLVAVGTENAVINVGTYDQEKVSADMENAVAYIRESFPLGAYAVESITYEIGLGGGTPAISVDISYIHGRSELRQIRNAPDMSGAAEYIGEALRDFDTGLVLLVESYADTDIAQMVADFADQNPDLVMEMPQVAVGLYPEEGETRVVELIFTYQTSRDALRQMRSQVQRVFESASLYVSSDSADARKYEQLYNFLMERFDYQLETSLTPSYSLLSHGVGDSKAFAAVYAAMCRQAELDCRIITGTCNGEPRYWNMIYVDGYYYHVDLLESSAAGRFLRRTDGQMTGYVWDYSAYPEAAGEYVPPTEESTEPITEVSAEAPTAP